MQRVSEWGTPRINSSVLLFERKFTNGFQYISIFKEYFRKRLNILYVLYSSTSLYIINNEVCYFGVVVGGCDVGTVMVVIIEVVVALIYTAESNAIEILLFFHIKLKKLYHFV